MDTNLSKPRLRSNIIIHRLQEVPPKAMLEDTSTKRAFMIREHERIVVEHFDGNRSLQQVADNVSDKLGIRLSASSVAKFAEQLNKLGLLESNVFHHEKVDSVSPDQVTNNQSNLNINSWARQLQPIAPLFFSLKSGWFVFLIVIALLSNALNHGEIYVQDLKTFLDMPYVWWTIILIYLGTPIRVVVHELGHTLATGYFTGQFNSIQAAFLLSGASVTPSSISVWGLKGRWRRIIIALAGLYFQTILLALIMTISPLIGSPLFLRQICMALIIPLMWSFVTNIIPCLPGLSHYKTDGYFALSYLVDIPNLAANSQKYIEWLLAGDRSRDAQAWLSKFTAIQITSLVFYSAVPWLGLLILAVGFWGISRFLTSQIPSTGLVLTYIAALWGVGPYLLVLGRAIPRFFKKGGELST